MQYDTRLHASFWVLGVAKKRALVGTCSGKGRIRSGSKENYTHILPSIFHFLYRKKDGREKFSLPGSQNVKKSSKWIGRSKKIIFDTIFIYVSTSSFLQGLMWEPSRLNGRGREDPWDNSSGGEWKFSFLSNFSLKYWLDYHCKFVHFSFVSVWIVLFNI